jgi:hypothetical protein
MRRLPQNISMLAVSIFTVSAVAVAPVYARQGSSDSSSSNTTTTTSTTSVDSGTSTGGGRGPSGISVKTDGSTKTVTGTETETETETEVQNPVDIKGLRDQAQQMLETKRQDGKTKSLEVRQQACDAHKAELTTRGSNYAKSAQKHLDVFNGIYDKVLAFQTSKNLTAANFDTLKSTADAKKAAAASAVAALSDPSVTTIDCTAQDPAANVATLKTAVANARTALQDYRKAIKDVIVALQAAKAPAGADDTSTDTNTTTGAN